MTEGPDRRRFVRSAVLGGTAALAGCAQLFPAEDAPSGETSSPPPATLSATPTDAPDGATVGLETVVDGIGAPTALAVPDSRDRAYLATRRGVVHVLGPDGLRDDPLLDLREAVMTGGERGLLGIALHPSFAETGRLFVRYSSPSRPGTPDAFSHTFVVAEFEATPDGVRAGRASERTILELPEPHPTHNAGALAFGPDGYLYVPTGDGGGVGLGHAEGWYDGGGVGNGQDTTENLLGGVLRLDVDADPTESPGPGADAPEVSDGEGGPSREGYAIPADNPLVDREGHRGEYYAWGFRNPWRLSFDGRDLFVADVGAAKWESIHRVEAGGNYGWSVREGTHCFRADECPEKTPPDVRGGEPLLDPVIQYPNDRHLDRRVNGSAAIAGYRYRGSALPGLAGEFLFADWRASGRLFAATPVEGELWPTEVVEVARADRPALHLIFGIERIAPDEWYVLGFSEEGAGGVHRLVPDEGA